MTEQRVPFIAALNGTLTDAEALAGDLPANLREAAGFDTDIGEATQEALDLLAPKDSPTFTGAATFPNTGLHVLDTNSSHDLIIKPGSNITEDRTFTVTTGDADRTLDVSAANVTISSFGASLVDDATKAAAQATLGIDYYAIVDAPTGIDDTASFTAALATGKTVLIPYSATPYKISPITLAASSRIVGQSKRPTIRFIGNGNAVTINGAGCEMSDIILDGQVGTRTSGRGINFDSFADLSLRRVGLINHPAEGLYSIGTTGLSMMDCQIEGNGSSGAILENTDDWSIEGCHFEDNAYFGCFAWKATRHGAFRANTMVGNGLEGYGQQFDCHHVLFEGNRSDDAGDNGLSINGYYNRVIGNEINGAANHGIAVYGSGNVVDGNTVRNSGQSAGGNVWCGIIVTPSWGGFGRDNMIGTNYVYDDQPVPTQVWGLLLQSNQYTAWANGVSVTSNSVRYHGDNVYRARNSGTTATGSEPTHLSGEATGADGVTWVYCGSRQKPLYERQTPWVANTAVLQGQMLYSGSNVYYVDVAGTTHASTAPSHTSGSAANGTTTLRHVRAVPSDFTSTGNIVEGIISWGNQNEGILDSGGGNIKRNRDQLAIRIPGTQLSVDLFAVNSDPEGTVSARPGSLALRTNGAIRAKTIAVKMSGTSNTGWMYPMLRDYGTTAQRPTAEMSSTTAGYIYMDTTIGREVRWSGTAWEDMDGRVPEFTAGVAAAGSDQATATLLTYGNCSISSGTGGVRLPTPVPNKPMRIFNRSGGAVNVYPASGHSINALAADAAYSLASNSSIEAMGLTTTIWGT